MPTYTIESPDGIKFDVQGDSPPTETELNDIYASLSKATPKPSPIAQQEAFKRQFIAQGTQTPSQQALSVLAQPVQGAIGLEEILRKGVQGVGSLYGEAAGQQGLANIVKNFNQNAAQTALEAGPRLAYESLGQGGVQAYQNPSGVLKFASNIVNPLAGIIQSYLLPERAPTQAQAQTAFENSQLTNALQQQGQQGILAEAQKAAGGFPIGTANIDVARALPLALGAGEVANIAKSSVQSALSPITKAYARSLPATVEQSAIAALDMAPSEVATHVPVVTQRVGELFKAVPKTAEEALTNIKTTKASLYQDALATDAKAAEQGLSPRTDIIIQDVRNTLDSIPNLLPEERTALLNDARARYSVSSPEEGRVLQQRLNHEFEAQYKNGTFDKAAPANEVKLAVRNSIANQMDEIGKAVTGIDATPYSDIGNLIEFEGGLNKTLEGIKRSEARSKTGIGAAPKTPNIPTTNFQIAYEAKKSALKNFKKTQSEYLNEGVTNIFRKGERAGEAIALDPAVQQSLIEKYGAQPTPPPIPAVAPEVSFSPSTIRALREFGVSPDNPRYQTLGQEIEAATSAARPRALLGQTINR